jgi:hypothetical protein
MRVKSALQLFVAMLLNGLGFTGRTLHMYSEYFESKPHERLLGEGISADDINDDTSLRFDDNVPQQIIEVPAQELSGEDAAQYDIIDYKDTCRLAVSDQYNSDPV